ncbi:MAG: ClcB-like voltage-gated chloride channel protein [Planctomycetes bacterium]|nr:ClcB-like voltage-gated chloride channel protein [Planctomycetota bacterium]
MRRTSVYRLLRLRVWLAERFRSGDTPSTYFWAGLVGLVGGASGPGFRWVCSELQYLLVGNRLNLVDAANDLPDWRRLLVPAVGGLLAGIVLMLGARLWKGLRATDYMEAVALEDGEMRARPALVRIGSSIFSIASGGSLGREGAMVQLAALLGSSLGRIARMPRPRLRLMIACGAAAGIASAYNAPIGGALFVAEIVLGSIAMESFGPLLFASFMATVITHTLSGGSPLYEMRAFELVSAQELVAYLGLGLLAGVCAPGFLWMLESSTRLFARLPMPLWARMALGGLIVGAISLQHPYVWGNGQGALLQILGSDWVWSSLLVLLLLKLAATAATIGSGAVGGVFTPTLLVGAVIGGVVGNLVHGFAPESTGAPHFYALVGAGAFLAATTHAPLMAILIMFDMTLAHEIVLPLMLACVGAYVVSQSLRSSSIYAVPRRVRHEDPPVRETLATKTVAELLRPDPPRISDTARFSEILDAFVGRRHNNLYVVDAQGVFQGVIPLHEIKGMLNDPELHRITIAHDFLREEFPRVEPHTTLAVALQLFTTHPIERLPVVDAAGQLLGSITKTDLLLALAGVSARPGA